MAEHYQSPNSFEHNPRDVRDIYTYAAEIQNRIARDEGNPLAQLLHFRDTFGCHVLVSLTAWKMLLDYGFDDVTVNMAHFLWGLYYMKHYPKEGQGCSTVGGSGGAVDPKTLRKYVWLIMSAIASLESLVVSNGNNM